MDGANGQTRDNAAHMGSLTQLRVGSLVGEALGIDYVPESQTPWQEIQRNLVGQLGDGAILEGAEAFQRIAETRGLPRDNH